MKSKKSKKSKTIELLLTSLLSGLFQPAMAQSDPILQSAQKHYQQGNHSAVVKLLSPAVQGTHKNNPVAHYYLGNAWLKLGRISQAHNHYKKVLLINPGEPLNGYCVSALKGSGWQPAGNSTSANDSTGSGHGVTGLVIDASSVKEVVPGLPAEKSGIKAGDKLIAIDGKHTYGMDSSAIARLLTGKAGTTVNIMVDRAGKRATHKLIRQSPSEEYKTRMTATRHSETDSARSTKDATELNPEDKALIKIHRRTRNTDYIYNQVARALKQLPGSVKDELRQHGCSILIAPTIVDARPELRNTKPEGYLHGGGYDNCPGMFTSETKILYIAETASWRNSPPQLNRWALPTTLHELGHAFDFCKGWISQQADFRKKSAEDSSRLTNTAKEKYWYYTQPGDRGLRELFAELFAVANGTGLDEISGGMAGQFPNCHKTINTLIGK